MQTRNVVVAAMVSAAVAVCLTAAIQPAKAATISWGSPLAVTERGESTEAESTLSGHDLLVPGLSPGQAAGCSPQVAAALMAMNLPKVGDSLPVFAKSDADQPSTLLVADFFFTDYRGLMEPFGTASGLTNPGQLIVEPLSSDLSAEMPLHRFAVRD